MHVGAAQGLSGEALAGPGRLDQQVVAVALDLADDLDKGRPREHLRVHHNPRILVGRGEGLKLAQAALHQGLGQLGAVQPLWVPVDADLFGDVQDGQARLIGTGYGYGPVEPLPLWGGPVGEVEDVLEAVHRSAPGLSPCGADPKRQNPGRGLWTESRQASGLGLRGRRSPAPARITSPGPCSYARSRSRGPGTGPACRRSTSRCR